MTAEVEVHALGGRRFRVQVRAGGESTTHDVAVPDRLEGGAELGDEDLAHVVRESFLFLLEREPASSILPRFSLDEITRYFPEYPGELAQRIG